MQTFTGNIDEVTRFIIYGNSKIPSVEVYLYLYIYIKLILNSILILK